MTTVSPISSVALAGIGFMLMAVFLFALNSAAGKWLLETFPVGEFMGIRAAITLILLSCHLARRARRVRQRAAAGVAGPAILSTTEIAINFGRSRIATRRYHNVLSRRSNLRRIFGVVLREQVGWRWTAVLIGFAGVVIALCRRQQASRCWR
jgi:S-adenosylmethionine uptake transporter